MNFQSILVLLCSVFLLNACASPYENFYQATPASVNGMVKILPPSSEPRIGSLSADAAHDVNMMYEQGYVLIGQSAFVGPANSQDNALQQAKKVGAEVVLVGNKYRNTVSGAMPITTPTTSTSFSNGSVNAVGSGSFASGTYTGTTTTYGSQTNYIPYSVDKYEQEALFFAPIARSGVGIRFSPATDEQKKQANTNQAVAVIGVRKESPAFKADIFVGDLILSINGIPVYDVDSYHKVIATVGTEPTKFVLLRNGKKITKEIEIPDWW